MARRRWAMREHERRRLDTLLAAAGVEDERTLPGPARLALHRLVASAAGAELVEGIAAFAAHAREVGQIEGTHR